MKTDHKKTDVYEIVTNRIIELLEQGVVPWKQSWSGGFPKNLISQKEYRGANLWLLSSLNYPQNYFLTFNQAKELGGSVKKGEKSHLVIFWKWLERQNPKTKEIEKTPLLQYYKVFNIQQCTGIPLEKIPEAIEREHTPIETCEKIIVEMQNRPAIRHKEQQAYYNILEDYINMPKPETFKNGESYYDTLFHELVHSTGHKDRLNRRELVETNGSRTADYAVEELTAEMGASYLKAHAGIPTEQLEDNASYIQVWLKRLKNDKKFIVHASPQAQKAVDFILNVKELEKEIEAEEKEPESNSLVANKTEQLKELRSKKTGKNWTLTRWVF